MDEVKFTESQLRSAQESIDKYVETYTKPEEVIRITKILVAQKEQVLSKSRFRKALRS